MGERVKGIIGSPFKRTSKFLTHQVFHRLVHFVFTGAHNYDTLQAGSVTLFNFLLYFLNYYLDSFMSAPLKPLRNQL